MSSSTAGMDGRQVGGAAAETPHASPTIFERAEGESPTGRANAS